MSYTLFPKYRYRKTWTGRLVLQERVRVDVGPPGFVRMAWRYRDVKYNRLADKYIQSILPVPQE